MENVTGRVVRSVKVTFVATIISGLSQLVFLVVLARLLDPVDYGVFALVSAVSALTTGLVAGAIERALVVEAGEPDFQGSVGVVGGIALCSALLVVTGAHLLNLAGITEVHLGALGLMLLSAVISGAALIPRVIQRRRIRYGQIAAADIAGQLLGTGLVSILLALSDFGVFALVLGMLARSVIIAMVLFIGTPGSLIWPPAVGKLKQALPATIQVTKISALEVAYGRIPIFVIGGVLGPSTLGLFTRAFSLIQLPIELLTNSMSRVMISGLATVAESEERLARGMRNLTLISNSLIAPMTGGMAASGTALVAVLLGEKWLEVAPVIPFLALATWAMMTAHLFAILAEAARRFREKLIIQIISTSVLLPAVSIGALVSFEAATLALGVSALLFLGLSLRLASQILRITVAEIIGWLVPGLIGASISAAWCLLAGHFLSDHPPAITLGAQIAGSGSLTLLYYAIAQRPLLASILQLVIPRAADKGETPPYPGPLEP